MLRSRHVLPAFLATALSVSLTAQQPALKRCGTIHPVDAAGSGVDHPDCDYYNTNPASIYAPTNVLRIPVVFHIIQSSGGTGNLSNSLVQSQITVLNEDFRAIGGTPGAPGVDTKIEFFLATQDPSGAPTTGILHYTNNTWFNDSGAYYNSIAWDTTRYLNIYTNKASGALGYVPDLPQGGSVLGTNADRVVIHYSALGRPGIGGAPYNQGRTATHEVGHYLGLFHTFNGGCGGGSCYTSGDRICDTNPESQPRYGCSPTATSCGSVDPVRNYMDYSDDTCMNGFTPEQAKRMRCTLQHYRSALAQPAGPVASATSRSGAGNFNTAFTATAPTVGSTAQMTVITFNTGFTSAAVIGHLQEATLPFQGFTILVDTTSPELLFLPFAPGAIFVTWTYQVPNDPSFAGLPIKTQAVMFNATSFGLTNAMDLVIG